MLLKLERTQRTAIGHLKANVAYDFDMNNAAQKKVATSLLERKMAVKTSLEEMTAASENLAERQRAELADATASATKPSALSEKAAAEKEAAEKEAAEKDAAEKEAVEKEAAEKAAGKGGAK